MQGVRGAAEKVAEKKKRQGPAKNLGEGAVEQMQGGTDAQTGKERDAPEYCFTGAANARRRAREPDQRLRF